MDVVERLSEEIARLLDVPLPDGDEARCAWLVELHRVQAIVTAAKAKAFRAVESSRAYAADGSKTVGAWLARECHASRPVTAAQARLARRLETMRHTMEALAAGEIGEEHALVLARAANSPRAVVVAAFPEAEELLVGYARDMYYDDFVVAVKHWENVVDEDGAEDDARRAYDRRSVHLSQVGDEFRLDGQFDLIEGTELDTALSRIERELFEEDWAAAKEANGGEEPALDQLARTPTQRRADALVEMARRAMAMPKGARKPEPLVTAVVDLSTLSGRVCELFDKTPITPGQVARILDKAMVERAVFDTPNRVIELGKRARFFRGGLRRAIEIRDRHCQHPGCRRPAEQCQVDHIQPHGWDGETVQKNGRLLCEHHNRWRVNGGRPKPKPKPEPPDEAAA